MSARYLCGKMKLNIKQLEKPMHYVNFQPQSFCRLHHKKKHWPQDDSQHRLYTVYIYNNMVMFSYINFKAMKKRTELSSCDIKNVCRLVAGTFSLTKHIIIYLWVTFFFLTFTHKCISFNRLYTNLKNRYLSASCEYRQNIYYSAINSLYDH